MFSVFALQCCMLSDLLSISEDENMSSGSVPLLNSRGPFDN